MVAPSLTLGELGQTLFGLGFVDTVLVIVFFNLLAVLTVCFFSTLGVAFGLRQMVLTRFWFGWLTAKGIAVLNILSCLGWSMVNAIVGAQLFYVVGNRRMPGYAGILGLASLTLIITFFGYRTIHVYENWSWIAPLVVFVTIAVTLAKSDDFVNMPWMGRIGRRLVLWIDRVRVWHLLYRRRHRLHCLPTGKPLSMADLSGDLAGNLSHVAVQRDAGSRAGDNHLLERGKQCVRKGYDEANTGGLLAALLFPQAGVWGKICVVLLALSIIATNCPNIYSISLSMKVIGKWANRVPRLAWVFAATLVYVSVAILAYFPFEDFLRNFMNAIGYWLAIYEEIALTHHFVFRRSLAGYQPEHYNQRDQLHVGVAACLAILCSVAGVAVGMSQTWWVGPVARHAGVPPQGGDVRFELGFAFASVAYAAFRYLESYIPLS